MGWTSPAHGLLLKVYMRSYLLNVYEGRDVVLKSWDIVAAFYSRGELNIKMSLRST